MITSLIALVTFAPLSVPVHVDGEGYLRFVRDGRVVYAKQATLTVTNGRLASMEGPDVNPRIQVAGTPTDLRIDLEGKVFGAYAGSEKELGRLVIAMFPDDVRLVVENGFLVSSYRPQVVDAGDGLAGVLRMGKPGGTTSTNVTAPAVIAGSVEIQLLESVEVTGKSFTLGEIATVVADKDATVRLNSLEITMTPAFGGVLKMSAEMVRLRLLRFGKEAETYKFSGANQVAVSRKGQQVTGEMFAAAATSAVRERIGGDVNVVCESPGQTITVALGKLELAAESVQENGSKYVVRIAILVDGERINSRTLTVDKNDALSKITVGMTVKVLVRSSGALVETTGRVRSVDRTSETVVVVTATGAELSGTAIAPGTIEVKL